MAAHPGAHTPVRLPHRAATKVRAQQLRKAGWQLTEICRILEFEGYTPVPHFSTVSRWFVERDGESSSVDRRRAARVKHGKFTWPGNAGPEWRHERMRRLRHAGLSYHAIAIVMTHDFPDAPRTEWGVRHELGADDLAPSTFPQTGDA